MLYLRNCEKKDNILYGLTAHYQTAVCRGIWSENVGKPLFVELPR
jgi:hypothetical protein